MSLNLPPELKALLVELWALVRALFVHAEMLLSVLLVMAVFGIVYTLFGLMLWLQLASE